MMDVVPDARPRDSDPTPRQDHRPAPAPASNSTYSISPNTTVTQNGFRDTKRLATPNDVNGSPFTAFPANKDGSRQTSVLANDVADQLSIEPQISDLASTDDDIEEEPTEEHEIPAPYASFLPTGYCYDVRMRYHCELDPPKERRELHPEDPRRIFKIYQELCIAGLIENEMLNKGYLIPNPLLNIPVRQATEAEVELVHDKRMWEFMVSTQSKYPYALSRRYGNNTYSLSRDASGGFDRKAKTGRLYLL